MSEYVHPDKIKELLIGKTIKDFTFFNYLGKMCFQEIHFTDGSFVELDGISDESFISGVQLSDGRQFLPEMPDA